MCLYFVSDVKPPKTGFGWKVFLFGDGFDINNQLHISGGLGTPTVAGRLYREQDHLLPANEPYFVGRWNVAVGRTRILARDGIKYSRGFHIYRHKKDAIKRLLAYYNTRMVVRQVQYEQGIAQGTDCQMEVIVANRMKIIRHKKGKAS